jgi:hypothetical protein
MNLSEYLVTPSGRVLTATVGWATAGAGAMALPVSTAHFSEIIASAAILAVVGSMFAVVLAATENLAAVTIALIIALPPMGGVYVAGLSVIIGRGIVLAAGLLLAGFFAIAMSIKGPTQVRVAVAASGNAN